VHNVEFVRARPIQQQLQWVVLKGQFGGVVVQFLPTKICDFKPIVNGLSPDICLIVGGDLLAWWWMKRSRSIDVARTLPSNEDAIGGGRTPGK